MPCQGRLQRPLWTIIKAIGSTAIHDVHATAARRPNVFHVRGSLQHARPNSTAVQEEVSSDGASKEKDILVQTTTDSENVQKQKAHRIRTARAKSTAVMRQRSHIQWLDGTQLESRATWSTILLLLQDTTPTGAVHYQKMTTRLKVSPQREAFCRIPGHVLVLEMRLRTGCIIEERPNSFVRQDDDISDGAPPRGFKHITLHGEAQEIPKALALLQEYVYLVDVNAPKRQHAFGFTVEQVPTLDHGSRVKPPRSRNVFDFSFMSYELRPLEEVVSNRPSEWTATAFANYVRDLTAARPRRLRPLAGTYSPNEDTVILNELKALYVGDLNLSDFITSEAVDDTLEWFCRKGNLQAVRQIASRFQTSSGYKMTASNYEVLLHHAAKRADVHNFLAILRIMLRLGLRPTWRSYAYLHKLVSQTTLGKASVVFGVMRRRGVLANYDALHEIAPDLIAATRESVFEQNLDEILAHFDQQFQSNPSQPVSRAVESTTEEQRDWFTGRTVANICWRLALLNRSEDIFTVLRKLKAKDGKVRHATILELVRMAVSRNSMRLAVDVLCHVESEFGFHCGQIQAATWDRLLRLAWKSRLFNVSRVIWRYACMVGHVPADMHDAMSRSLLPHTPSREMSSRLNRADMDVPADDPAMLGLVHLFFGWIAKYSVGVADGPPVSWFPADPTTEESPRALSAHDQLVLNFAQPPRHRSEVEDPLRWSVHTALLQADCQTSCVPTESFSKTLKDAWAKDLSWLDPAVRPYQAALDLKWSTLKDLTPEQRHLKVTALLQQCFERMLRDGVKVPVKKTYRFKRTYRFKSLCRVRRYRNRRVRLFASNVDGQRVGLPRIASGTVYRSLPVRRPAGNVRGRRVGLPRTSGTVQRQRAESV